MILLFTDFGSHDLYVGQVKAVLAQRAAGIPVIDLLHEVPNFDARKGAYLLAGLLTALPPSSVTLAVVDAGVGGGRRAVVLEADGRWFVGPDNGLLSVVAGRSRACRAWEIIWRPARLSSSFHGRDLFAPIAAMIAAGAWWPGALDRIDRLEVMFEEADLAQVIYLDHYGNALTGLRAAGVARDALLGAGGRRLPHARVFSDVPPGQPFWYENSIGLVEIAVNQGSAAQQLGLSLGDAVAWAS